MRVGGQNLRESHKLPQLGATPRLRHQTERAKMIWFISDTHFSHARIIELSNRPFGSVEEMNEEIVRRWNEVVAPEDEVFHLGDVALGPIAESLPIVSRLNGTINLITGNHDRPFPPMQKGREDKIAHWTQTYLDAGFISVYPSDALMIGGQTFRLSHFPYDGDSHEGERFVEYRLPDDGTPLIHGHTHSNEFVTRSRAGTLQFHVGVDAHDFRPVSETQIWEAWHEQF